VSQGGTIAGAVATLEGIGLVLSRSCYISLSDTINPRPTRFPVLATSGCDDQVYPVQFQQDCLKWCPHAHWKLFYGIDHHKYSRRETKYIVEWILTANH
jgi:hypothetical protein